MILIPTNCWLSEAVACLRFKLNEQPFGLQCLGWRSRITLVLPTWPPATILPHGPLLLEANWPVDPSGLRGNAVPTTRKPEIGQPVPTAIIVIPSLPVFVLKAQVSEIIFAQTCFPELLLIISSSVRATG